MRYSSLGWSRDVKRESPACLYQGSRNWVMINTLQSACQFCCRSFLKAHNTSEVLSISLNCKKKYLDRITTFWPDETSKVFIRAIGDARQRIVQVHRTKRMHKSGEFLQARVAAAQAASAVFAVHQTPRGEAGRGLRRCYRGSRG